MRGGGAGGAADQRLIRRDGVSDPLAACAQVTLASGERILSISCGGGGYGPPAERAPQSVARDVNEGWISRDRARSIYGVAVDEDGAIDNAATTALRARAPVSP